MSTFKRPQEFYVYAIHAIYAVILASSYQILEDVFVPISDLGHNFNKLVNWLGVLLAYSTIKVPETITHVKRMDVNKGAITAFEEFLDKISPLRTAKKLGAILFQLLPSFAVNDFKNIEKFLSELPHADGYDYALEFRHPSWSTEGPWEMLKHYNIAAVMTDSPQQENLQFLSDVIVTADPSFVRLHGRNTKGHYWYNYLYSEQELQPWVDKVNQIRKQTRLLRVYFNNHYGGKAVVNAMQFKEMNGMTLSADERKGLENAQTHLQN